MLRKQAKRLIGKISENNYQTLNLIELSRANLLNNVNLFLRNNPSLSIISVLKSNAYGHGLSETAQILNDANCDYLAVDGYFEAAKIRDITRHKILVLGYIRPDNVKLLDTKKCSFVVQDTDGLKALASLNKPVRVHVELDTGMSRLGLQPNELAKYLKVLKKLPLLKLDGVMTHLADADNTNNNFTNRQVQLFDELIEQILNEGFEPKHIHVAQTAGSTKASSKYANSMRIGIGLYGISPLRSDDRHYRELNNLLPVLELKSTIIKILDLKPGDRVSYNGIYTATKPMRIGVLPLGYYEGLPRELSNKGVVMFKKEALPIVGRVCMNHTMIDLRASSIEVGDTVTVISNDPRKTNSIKQICEKNDLFNYSLMTGISDSTKRVIVD